ncbi:MAG: hypothetical protein LBI86_02085 [Treponema sp.]|nr:hypothetical protein [Treponema sp.]
MAGCTSVPVPTPEQNTLVAGKFLVNWKTTDKMRGGNGTYRFGIRIYFRNNQSGKIFFVSTQKDGWFLTGKLAGGSYTIQKFFIERNAGRIYQMTLNGPFFITLEEGMVNNMGVIQIDLEDDGYSYQLVDYDVVKLDFQSEFPDSEWNFREWKTNNVFAK